MQTAALQHSSYKLKVASSRGNIYDYKKNPIVGEEKDTIATVFPCIQTAKSLSKLLSVDEISEILPKLKSGKPFCVNIKNSFISDNYIKSFKVPKRYSDDQLAPHIIGYLDSDGKGVCAIEKAFNNYLDDSKGYINLKYKVDALGRMLSREDIAVENTMYKQTSGVVLTIDKDIQRIVQSIAQEDLPKGAIIVTSVPNCEIRACVSMPNFSPNNISQALDNENSPLLNRAFLSYNVGSIFKLVTAAAAVENGSSPDNKFCCTGSINVNDSTFHCSNSKVHGEIDLMGAISLSCNSYFVNLTRGFDGEKFLKLAMDFGFGKPIELAPEMFLSSGNLPEFEVLKNASSMANFSFGQGTLMATPVQISGLINTIAAKGKYVSPKLVLGLVNENLEYVKKNAPKPPKQIITKRCANVLKSGMIAAVEMGTGIHGKPENYLAAAKTGTAQTGIKDGERSVIQAWYAGFYPAENPKYSIVILSEDSNGGGASCGPIFKKIVDKIYSGFPEKFLINAK
ncbi:MAG: Stage V sporulation protein D [Eubacteriales bacterium SKADARSKE-1]|nr:Stage V sporulation protein D [Eubacteriales bacterium SKADARSKE-1]